MDAGYKINIKMDLYILVTVKLKLKIPFKTASKISYA